MSDFTQTPNYALYKPSPNADNNLWGDHLNLNADTIDSVLHAGFGVNVPPGGSIQAALDALPATGGRVILAPDTTYVLTATASTTKPNVHVWAPSWNTIIRRDPSFNAANSEVLRLQGANSIAQGFTVDGNGVEHVGAELALDGSDSIATGCKVINSKGDMHLRISGADSIAMYNRIIGPGAWNLETGYGIWAMNSVPLLILGNHITNTNADGIGFNGSGSRCIGNYIANCHLYTGNGGGQLAFYDISLGANPQKMALTANNYIGPAGVTGDGIEISGKHFTSVGDVIDGVSGYGIHVTDVSGHVVLSSGIIHNTGGANPGLLDGIIIAAGVTDVTVKSMQITDDRATPLMRSGIAIVAGAGDDFLFQGNNITGMAFHPIYDQSTGLNKIIANNLGLDNAPGHVPVSATMSILQEPVQIMSGSGTVTTISGALWNNRSVQFLAAGATTFQAGSGNIGNTVTCAANNYVEGRYLSGAWYFK